MDEERLEEILGLMLAGIYVLGMIAWIIGILILFSTWNVIGTAIFLFGILLLFIPTFIIFKPSIIAKNAEDGSISLLKWYFALGCWIFEAFTFVFLLFVYFLEF